MKIFHVVQIATFASCLASAQGSFQNLGFEDAIASYPLTPNAAGYVPASDAIPGWTPYIGTVAGTGVEYNTFNLGNPAVVLDEDVFGTNQSPFVRILSGGYSVLLQAGFNGQFSAAVGQTGLIPLGTRSITLKAAEVLDRGALELSIGGQSVSLVPVSITSAYTVYGGDISQFAGQTADLRITSLPDPTAGTASWLIDDIQFSASAIPEPSTVALLVIGAAMAGRRLATHRR